MNFWRRLRFYLIGVAIGLVVSFSFFKNRGCGWLPGNRVLNTLSGSMILVTDSTRCLMDCNNISDEDVFRMFVDGDVLFSESQTRENPKIYVVQGERVKDESEFKLSFLMRDSTATVDHVFGDSKCNCNGMDNDTARIMSMPEAMIKEIFLSRDVTATVHADCQIKCRNWEGAYVRQLIIDGKIDFSTSTPRSHPHPQYTVVKENVTLKVELAPKKTRVLDVIVASDTTCSCNE